MSTLHVLFMPSWYYTDDSPAAGIFFTQQALALQRLGVKVGFIYPELRSVRDLRMGALAGSVFVPRIHPNPAGFPEVRLKGWAFRHIRPWVSAWAAKVLLKNYIKQFGRPHLVHAHSAVWAGFATSFLPLSYVLTEHWSGYWRGHLKAWERPLVQRALRRAQARLAVSSALAEDMRPFVGDLPIEVVPNLVDTELFSPTPERPVFPPFRLVAVASLIKHKGVDTVIQATAYLVREGWDVMLDIVGDGPERVSLESLAKNLGVEGRVRFWGSLPSKDLVRVIHASHLFVLPSEYETFGVVYIEAMACGLPVVATERGGPRDFVTSEVGRLVPPRKPEVLAVVIKEIMDNYHLFDPRRIRERVVQNFSAVVVGRKILDVYEKILGGPLNSSSDQET